MAVAERTSPSGIRVNPVNQAMDGVQRSLRRACGMTYPVEITEVLCVMNVSK